MNDQLPNLQRRRTARPKTAGELSGAYPISIIIPFFNARNQLARTLPALARNDLRDCEILLVDDGSHDGSGDLARNFEFPAASRVVTLSSRSGPAGARNRGIEEAIHPYLFFLDADVVIPEKSVFWIRETLDVYRHRSEVQGVLGVYSTDLPDAGFFTHFKNLYTRYLYDTTETLSPFVHTPIFCVRRQVLVEAGGFDGRLETAEDFRLGISLGSRGHRFVIDRRIAGVHLKSYGLASILKEDRRRIADLRRVWLAPEERDFYYRAHRWSRILSVLLPGAILIFLLASFWFRPLLWVCGGLALLFLLLNFRFLAFCRRQRGFLFTLGATLFLWLEMAWASVAGLEASLRHRRLSN